MPKRPLNTIRDVRIALQQLAIELKTEELDNKHKPLPIRAVNEP